MAGHSKWANIKFRKAAQDSKRGKIFTKLIREITISARAGGEEVANNPRLRDAIDKALKANMKRDTVNNAIKRGVGGLEGNDIEEVTYEGYGPGGVAILVECMTDNRNRTVSEVRHAFSKMGGNLGTDGSVAYLFQKRGEFLFPKGTSEELMMEMGLEANAEDITTLPDGSIEVITPAESFNQFKELLSAKEINAEHADLVQAASLQVPVDRENAEKLIKLIDMLEDLDDVQNVYSNADISDEIMKELA